MKKKLLSLIFLVMFSCFALHSSGFYKEYMQFKGKLGNETIVGAIAMTKDKTFGNYLYYNSSSYEMYKLEATSCKSIGKGKYQISFKVELDGVNQGTWNVTFNTINRTATGTMKDKNGKSLKIDLNEWKR